ncbi:hypothetical protein BIV23_29300 [Streptomyces monashensis]|uniref:Uncharacterized protein n=1 Tax=Streptomyces monashensis TaxID=1678012 RepID=A0A1S2Q125_9ACTN|nr:hypothetical protein BIV23_29300 [Streptomyces monashensis]
MGVGVAEPSLGRPLGESPGVGVPPGAVLPPEPGACPWDRPSEGVAGPPEGTSESDRSRWDADAPRPPTASLTVVPVPPLRLLPETSSYVVMPAIVTPNTTAAATTGRRQLFTRAR